MEIHAPHHPVMTLREFVVHLLVVTVGILIALGLEQSVEAFHHHELAKEARENMKAEIADNEKELENNAGKIVEAEKERQKDIDVIDQLLAHKNLNQVSVALNFSNATLSSSSWSTAASVGALAYMDYAEVKSFAKIYKLQALLEQLQDDQIKSVQAGFGALSSLQEGPEKVPANELLAMKRALRQNLIELNILGQIGKQLREAYGKALRK